MLFGSIHLKHGRDFNYISQPLNMRMRVCYLDCHEAGLCCYLVIQCYIKDSCFITPFCDLFSDSPL
jgi:hypothetical protein